MKEACYIQFGTEHRSTKVELAASAMTLLILLVLLLTARYIND